MRANCYHFLNVLNCGADTSKYDYFDQELIDGDHQGKADVTKHRVTHTSQARFPTQGVRR